MEDLTELASSLAAGLADVRGCLILSRDGLVLAAHPNDAERTITPAWVRFASTGDPERGFVQFGAETWCYVRRGPYAAFAVTGIGVRPGLVLDHMEQVLLAAEESRARREAARPPEPVAAPSSKPRAPLHPEVADAPVVLPAAAPVRAAAGQEAGSSRTGADGTAAGAEAAGPVAEANAPRTPDQGDEGPDVGDAEPDLGHGDVDRFSLAREFGALLQDDEGGADG